MNFQEAVEWLYTKLPMFQRIGDSAYKKDLGNIKILTEKLGNPQNNYKIIHVAGTNGKGSTSHMLSSILQEAGYKVGLTTSPHLKDFRERIRVNGQICSEQFVINFVTENAAFIEDLKCSFFEVSVAMAFQYFNQEEIDIAVVETGLGGRLDSTNIVLPIVSVITNIGYDHMKILGNTLAEIAFEKAGIIKKNIPVVIGETNEEIQSVFENKAIQMDSPIFFSENEIFKHYESDLKGIYQKKNIRTVLTTLKILREKEINIEEENIRSGLINVVKNTGLKGRWETLQTNPLVVADTAHNIHGLVEIVKQIEATSFENLHLVLGFVNDKDVVSILEVLPKNAKYYFCEPNVPRKMKKEELEKVVPKELYATFFPNVQGALDSALSKANENDMIYVGGSTFVVAEVI